MDLARWMAAEMAVQSLSQRALADRSGVAIGTINKILKRGYVPKIEILFLLGECLGTDRVEMLIIAGHLTQADQLPRVVAHSGYDGDEDVRQEWQLIRAFRTVPREYRKEVVEQVKWISRLVANRGRENPAPLV